MLLLALGCTLVSAALIAALLPRRGTVAYLVAMLLLAQAMIIGGTGFAGLVLRSLAASTLTLIAVAWLVLAVAAVLQRGGIASWRLRSRRAVVATRHALVWPPVAVATVLMAGTLAWRLFLAIRLPVVDYDGWSYHLVFADVWLQHDQIVGVLQRPWTSGYPANSELLTTWLMAFTRTDALAGLTSLLPIPLAMVAVTGLARVLGAAERPAALAGLLFGMTPALVALAGSTYVDATSVATVTATWYIGLRLVRGERDAAAAALLGIAGGLAAGTKGTNLPLVAPILVAAGLLLVWPVIAPRRARPGVGDRRAAAARLAWLVVPVVLFGGSWYIKNLVAYGNPVYPFAVGPFPGPETFSSFAWAPPQLERLGGVERVIQSWLADWRIDHYAYNVRPGGIGRAWLLVVPLALAGIVLVARSGRRSLAALGLVLAPALFTFVTAPNPWYARYTLFIPALGLAFAMVALGRLPRRLPPVVGLLLVAVATISLVHANTRPNISLRPAVERQTATPRQYLRLLLDGDDARRRMVSLRASCAGFATIPPGSRVAPEFNLLHGVVGPNLDRILTDPLADTSTPGRLIASMNDQEATWLVTVVDGAVDTVARQTPALTDRGEVCQGARLWSLAGDAGVVR
jgi:hypothetical protein